MVRELELSDAEQYLALRMESEQEVPESVGFNAERELQAGADGIRPLLSTYALEGTRIWGAFEMDRLLGTVALSRRLSPKYRHKAFLWGMYVKPASRGSGVSSALMAAVVSWAMRQPGLVAISLQVTTTNARARRFYERSGFVMFGTERRSLFVEPAFHDVHYMELELNGVTGLKQRT